MAYTGIWQDNLPWSDTENDRKLVGYVFISLIVCTIIYTIAQFLPLQEVKQKNLEEVAPRLAKLIIERQKKPPPPPPIPQAKKKETPKPEPKKPRNRSPSRNRKSRNPGRRKHPSPIAVLSPANRRSSTSPRYRTPSLTCAR